MTKIIKIDCCMECPYIISDDSGTFWCSKSGYTSFDEIPSDVLENDALWNKCPLEDE